MLQTVIMSLFLSSAALAPALAPAPAPSSVRAPARASADARVAVAPSERPDVVDAKAVVPSLLVDIKYATADNFVGRVLYAPDSTGQHRCLLHSDAAAKLAKAEALLKERAPSVRLLAYDCLRPVRVQRAMWDVVKGTPKAGYVADPNSSTGSVHNYGCAIDLTLATEGGAPLDMGTEFDHLGPRAEPRLESKHLDEGLLSHTALANRLLLRQVMVGAGFYMLPNEWWHFNCAASGEVRKKYKPVP